jgi:hypothetical protein
MLSVIIITKNEAHSIDGCLKSVAWADEIIVVDSAAPMRRLSYVKNMEQKYLEMTGRGLENKKIMLCLKLKVLGFYLLMQTNG